MLLLLLLVTGSFAFPAKDVSEHDENSRKLLGSSVVTSVSVIMDTGNGTQTYYADAVGKPVSKPSSATHVASPVNLLNPGRYEFLTFDDNGFLVKHLMSLEEIQRIIAIADPENAGSGAISYLPEKKVNDIVTNVQNVLKEEIKSHKNSPDKKPILDTPNVTSSWNKILPAFFGNGGDMLSEKLPTSPDSDIVMLPTGEEDAPIHDQPATFVFNDASMDHMEEIKPVHIDVPATTAPPNKEIDIPVKESVAPIILTSTNKIQIEKAPITTSPLENNHESTKEEPTHQTSTAATTSSMLVDIKTTTVFKSSTISPISVKPSTAPLTEAPIKSPSQTTMFQYFTSEPPTEKAPTMQTHPQVEEIDIVTNINLTSSTIKPSEYSISTDETTILPTIYPYSNKLHDTKPEATTKAAIDSTSLPLVSTAQVTIKSSVTATSVQPVTSDSTEQTPLDKFKEVFINHKTAPSNEADNESTSHSNLEIFEASSSNTLAHSSYAIKSTTPILLIIHENIKNVATSNPNIESTTSGQLSTFFIISDDNKETSTKSIATSEVETSNKTSVIENGSQSEETVTTPIIKNITTEKLAIKITPTNPDEIQSIHINNTDVTPPALHGFNESVDVTTENALNKAVTEILDTLLLSSTNIYEINTQLAAVTNATIDEYTTETQVLTTEPPKAITNQDIDLQTDKPVIESITETINNATSESKWEEIALENYTSENTLIASIEQLIQQTVGNVEEPIADIKASNLVENLLNDTNAKPMHQMQVDSATIGSSLVDKGGEVGTGGGSLSEAVISILSQVYTDKEFIQPTTEETVFTELIDHTTHESIATTEYVSEVTKNATEDIKLTTTIIAKENSQDEIMKDVTENTYIKHTTTEDDGINTVTTDTVLIGGITTENVPFSTEGIEITSDVGKVTDVTEITNIDKTVQDEIAKNDINKVIHNVRTTTEIIQTSTVSDNLESATAKLSPVKANENVTSSSESTTIGKIEAIADGNKTELHIVKINETINNLSEDTSTETFIPITESTNLQNITTALESSKEGNANITKENIILILQELSKEKIHHAPTIEVNSPNTNDSNIRPTETIKETDSKIPNGITESIKVIKKDENIKDLLPNRITDISIIPSDNPRGKHPVKLHNKTNYIHNKGNDTEPTKIINIEILKSEATEYHNKNQLPAESGANFEKVNLFESHKLNVKKDVSATKEYTTTIADITTEKSKNILVNNSTTSSKPTVEEENLQQTTIIYDIIKQSPNHMTTTKPISTTIQFVTETSSQITTTESTTESQPKVTTNIPTVTTAKVPTSPQPTTSPNLTVWTLVPTVLPHSNATLKEVESKPIISIQTPPPVKLSSQSSQGFGLEDSTTKLDADIYQFVELCNELSFGFWNAVTNGISSARSVFVSPFAATSLLAMVFLGARGATSGEMNEILRLDDMVTFNPHLIFKNVTESIAPSANSGVAKSVIVRELYSDKNKGKLLNFYKERAKQFYDGHVEEVGFKDIGDFIRRRTNLLVKKYTNGKIEEYMRDNSIVVRPPLAGVSASIFQTDCSSASIHGRDGELHFVVLPTIRQRRLIPIPAVVYRNGFLAGYDPTLDATAAAIGSIDQTISTIFVIPGQQGVAAPGDGLARLEKHLVSSAFKQDSWPRLLRTLIPRPGLELQIPRFSHKSIINATVALQKMGLKDLFSFDKADLRGLSGVAHELHLSDILQINNFATCGEGFIGDDHHSEIYPATSKRPTRRSRRLDKYESDRVLKEPDMGEEPRDYQRAFHDPLHDPTLLSLPLPLRPRQARIPDAPRLRFDRPFLFFVRHNPTGLILHMGRFNPRLLP